MAIRKFKITCVVCITLLLGNTVPKAESYFKEFFKSMVYIELKGASIQKCC